MLGFCPSVKAGEGQGSAKAPLAEIGFVGVAPLHQGQLGSLRQGGCPGAGVQGQLFDEAPQQIFAAVHGGLPFLFASQVLEANQSRHRLTVGANGRGGQAVIGGDIVVGSHLSGHPEAEFQLLADDDGNVQVVAILAARRELHIQHGELVPLVVMAALCYGELLPIPG